MGGVRVGKGARRIVHTIKKNENKIATTKKKIDASIMGYVGIQHFQP